MRRPLRVIDRRGYSVDGCARFIGVKALPERPLSNVLIENADVRCKDFLNMQDANGFVLHNATLYVTAPRVDARGWEIYGSPNGEKLNKIEFKIKQTVVFLSQPLAKFSQPLANLSQPLTKFSQPLARKSRPLIRKTFFYHDFHELVSIYLTTKISIIQVSHVRKIKEDSRFSAAEDRGRYSVSSDSAAIQMSFIFFYLLLTPFNYMASGACES